MGIGGKGAAELATVTVLGAHDVVVVVRVILRTRLTFRTGARRATVRALYRFLYTFFRAYEPPEPADDPL
jgi:hypothetical protein